MHRKIFTILSIIVIVLTITGCQIRETGGSYPLSKIHWNDLQITPQAKNSLCWDLALAGEIPNWDEMKQNFQSGLLMGMSATDISDAKEVGYQTYTIALNQPIKMGFHLWYPEQNTNPAAAIRFFALLNEKQLPNVFASNQYYKDVIIPPGNETTLSLHLPPLDAGIYDFIIIGIPYIENYPTPEGIVKVLYHRISLIAGAPSIPFRQISFSDLPPYGLISKGDPKISLSLALADDSIETWNWPEQWLTTKPGVPLKFSILAGHEDVTNLDAPHINKLVSSFFSLLLFFDYQQIEIAPNQTAIYGKVNENTAYTSTSAEIILPSSGKHQILALRINSPGIPMCILRPPPGGRILPSDVTGILVGVDVVSPEE